jgi:branched-chain amino acid transport system ATP-binding protein
MSGSLLSLHGLVAGYGSVPVVHGLDLSVDPGEVVALLGPNGAGKTTTLLTVSGLLRPLAGTVELFGRTRTPSRRVRAAVGGRSREGLAHVSEDRSLFSGLTVEQNLALGTSRRQAAAEVHRALELFPALHDLRDRRAGLLSGGEQQMLAIARALVGAPRLLMVDELSLGLAPLVVDELLPVLRRLADDHGVGVLLVEQHVGKALQVADRAVVLSQGRVVLEGDAGRMAEDPSRIAAAYLGERDDSAMARPVRNNDSR